MVENISPEERLFKVIRKEKESFSPGISGEKIFPSAAGINHFFSGLIPKPRQENQSKKPIVTPGVYSTGGQGNNLKLVNKILSIILAGLLIMVVYYSINKQPNPSKPTNIFSNSAPQSLQLKPIETFKPLSYYTEQVKKRDAFRPVPQPEGVQGLAGLNLQELIKDLSLAGIYQGQSSRPEVMIEDKLEKKTYFLKEGDEIKGMKVKSILKDRVILQYGEQEIEIL